MANLLNNDDLNVSSEEHIFQALMSWIQHDSVTRRQFIGQLLGLVKLPLLSPAFLTDHVEPVIEGNLYLFTTKHQIAVYFFNSLSHSCFDF